MNVMSIQGRVNIKVISIATYFYINIDGAIDRG